MKTSLSLLALIAALPAFAEETRQLGAHEHGVGTLNIAFDGAAVAMEFEAPGADIVGFEYTAESDADLAAIDSALGRLSDPLDLFVMSPEAGCTVTAANVELEGGESHDGDHDHGDEHDHDDDHDHGEDHGDAGHDGHDDHDHDHDHGDEDKASAGGHTEFHAEYALNCEAPEALTGIDFAYFEAFPNALEVEVQVLSASGAQAYEVGRDAPLLTLGR